MPRLQQPDCLNCDIFRRSVLAHLSIEELKEVNLNKGCSHYKKGQVIFREGEYPHEIFAVNSGKVKISKTGTEETEQIVRFAKTGDLLGYRSLLCGDKYLCTATALEDTSACSVPGPLFFKFIQENANLSLEVMKLLANDLGKAEKTIKKQTHKNVRERMAEALLLLVQVYGFEPDNATINISLSREEIAGIVGTGRESATKFLAEFKNEGTIEFAGKKIRIIDQQRLTKLANELE